MTLNEIEDFLIRISKEEDANGKLSDAMSCVLMKQALFFNIAIMITMILTSIFTDMTVWGSVIGLLIVSSALIYRTKKIKNEYLKDANKIAKKEKIHLFSDFFIDYFDNLLTNVNIEFIIKNLVNENISEDIKIKISDYLVNNKETLSYSDLNTYLKKMKSLKDTADYIVLENYFEDNKAKLLGRNFKDF